MTEQPPIYLDTAAWPRHAAFDYFRDFSAPFFGLCTRLDVTRLKPALAAAGTGSVTLALHYLALRLANEVEPFRYRLEGERVRVHPLVHGGATVLRADDSFAFADLDYHPDYARFAGPARDAMAAARDGRSFEPRPESQAVIHITTLPWLHFSSFVHARHGRRPDSVPKIAFGRIDADGEGPGARLWLPLSVDVHHALMDGLHVGRYVQGFEAALREPEAWLAPVARGRA
jgi:chloramphenicol O-acetyltransferase type A